MVGQFNFGDFAHFYIGGNKRWVERGVIEGAWAALIEECRELDGADWEWQSADRSMGKARFGGALSDAIPRTVGRREAKKASWSTGPAGH